MVRKTFLDFAEAGLLREVGFLHILRHLKIYKVSHPGNYCPGNYLMILIYTHWTVYRKEGYFKNTNVS